MKTLTVVYDTIRANLGAWLTMTFGFVLVYYFTLLAIVVWRIGSLPNYAVFYNWPADVLNIIRSTPSVSDMLPIISNEWVFETGYKNYDYGHGIAEWSLAIIPPKVVVVALLGSIGGTSVLLLHRLRTQCSARARCAGAAAAGLGSLLVAMANVTLFWVSCCSTATWVVGLSLLGLETASAYALLPYGPDLSLAGFAILLVTNYVLARFCLPPAPRQPAATTRSPFRILNEVR
jgi:hypothetical protein